MMSCFPWDPPSNGRDSSMRYSRTLVRRSSERLTSFSPTPKETSLWGQTFTRLHSWSPEAWSLFIVQSQ